MERNEMKARSFKESFKYALAGLHHTWKSQRNFKLHVVSGFLVTLFSYIFGISYIEFLFVVSAVLLVLVMELLNTALEATVDLITTEFHPLAYIAKNVGAGAVLLSACYALIVGIVVFGRQIVNFF